MNLFERLLHRRLCNEQPADGGAAPAPSEPSAPAADAPAPAADPANPEGEQPQAGKPQDDKPADGEKPADKPAEEKEQKQEGAPEKYEFKPAEGQELDTAALEQFEPIARELNLTNEQAQKMVDLYGTKIMPMVQKQQAEAWQKQTEGWAETVKADKEIGGDKLTANLSAAQRALEQFGDPELKEYLDSTGLGNHPALVKAFIKVGKAMSEDKVVTGGHESGGSDLISAFYPKK
ncbi:peptidase [Enterobacter hormaechei]|uniref:peptidase n=1 Tax=Enterobacter hormaechei TaxID=158836 RepID=UPI0007356338|nr:peptidase [Enterobacter hormaechei]KTI41019.1 peptidase [Enterobacter hormaechei subsp. xiangfangensis]KTJ85217.1 peptidase [Enterobacter hormaechei subsp. xiangfangensis]HAS0837772.1 peptidase [Enterobacter hormaechei subsp. xiangfangensis]HDV7310222.1 peptidase [Enterobacter hormaechei]HDV7313186.1 peptidase [Enterobacter hormaechei]